MNSEDKANDDDNSEPSAKSKLKTSQSELQKARAELEECHKSLLQNEKMASLGVLSAGVAHEINNPVGYILSNITTLGEYMPQITSCTDTLLELVADISEDNPLYARRIAVEQILERNELNYLLSDINDLVEETREGAIRVLDIVRGLKNFAHSGEDTMVYADLNDCLVSTLNLVNNELKYHCKVTTRYGDIPNLRFSVSRLGQVFMNILVNAGHATGEDGEISITTRAANDEILVTIEDNGCGMSKEVQGNIFNPFFTTKDKGLGTGLGLAISNEIIEEHGGSIQVKSTLGSGTTFIISLPLQLNH